MWVHRLAILVFTMVPAIIGGGIIWNYTGPGYAWVTVWEIVLYGFALWLVFKGIPQKKVEDHAGSH